MSDETQQHLDERRAQLSPEKRALLERRLRGAKMPAQTIEIPKRPELGPVSLSYPQESLWFLEEYAGGFGAYNVPVLVRFHGALDASRLRASLLGVVARHESLRTRFRSEDGVPVQIIDPDARLDWTEIGCSVSESLAHAETEAARPFDLSSGPLIRATLYKLSPAEHLLCVTIHHIVFDGWSVGILLKELAANYAGEPLEPLPLQFGDYAAWQRAWFQGEHLDRSLAYWKDRLQGPLPSLELPTDRPRPAAQTFRGEQACRSLSPGLTEQLRGLSQRESVTLFVTLLAGWGALLHRYTGQDDLITGTGIAGRTRAELEGLIGFFVNTLALRLDLSGDPEFTTLLRRMQQVSLEAFEHQETPFEALVAALHPERGASRSPLFQVMFVFHNAPAPTIQFNDIEGRVEELHNAGAKFDLTFAITDHPEGLHLALEYNADLFDAPTVERLLAHYETLLSGACASPETHVSALPLLTESERHTLLEDWNATARAYPRESSLGVLFAAQAASTPDAIAIACAGVAMTYHELNARSNRLARYLQTLGVGPETLVGLCANRSADLVVATLAIVKAGGAYVPLDPGYPAARLAYILEDTAAPAVLVQRDLQNRFPAGNTRRIELDDASVYADFSDADFDTPATGDSLAYVMYTSGSTGTPKGVCIPHRAIARLVLGTDYLQLGPNDRVAQAANTAFDAATFEIWGPLLNGGCTVIMPREVSLTARDLAAFLRSERITAMFLTTALFNQTAQQAPDAFRTLRCVMFGGEQCDPNRVRAVLQSGPPERLLHVYGPTETTTFATWRHVTEVPENSKTIPIGRPLANTTAYILDATLQPVPVGVPGELYLGGDGLAREYLHSPEATAARFIETPLGGRLYKTGDRVRYLSDGSIEFLGRTDFQVKIRGFRIELGEIESVLNHCGGVGETLVLVREDAPGDKRLIAYIVPRADSSMDIQSLRAQLRERLPDYMIPSAFVTLDAFPLNRNGKVDRRALPAPEREAFTVAANVLIEPRTDVEQAIAEIWREILHLDRIGIHDNFFDLGGHSLLATQVVSKLNDALDLSVPLRALFETQTIAGLAARISALRSAGKPASTGDPCIIALNSSGSKRPFFCAAGAGTVAGYYGSMASCFADDRPFYGLQDPRLEEEHESFPRVEDLAARFIQAIRTVQPQGPYLLGGWSFGGIVAFEMAQQLTQQGERVAFLGLIDTVMPRSAGKTASKRRPTIRIRVERLLNWTRVILAMRVTVFGYLCDAGRLMLDALLGRTDPAVAHLKPADYFRWVKHDLGTQYDLKQAGLIDPKSQRNRLTLIHEPFVWHVFKTTHARGLAMDAYTPSPCPGRLTLLRAEDLHGYDSNLGWTGIPARGIDVRDIPGNHTVVLRKPYVDTLAAELRKCLDTESPD